MSAQSGRGGVRALPLTPRQRDVQAAFNNGKHKALDDYEAVYGIYTGGWRCGFLWGLIGGSVGALIGGIGAVAAAWWTGVLP